MKKDRLASYRLLNFKIFGDERGSLIPLEGLKNIPFEIKKGILHL